MQIIIFLLFTLFIFHPNSTMAQSSKEMQAQLQKQVSDLKGQIAELEKQIETAKKENPESVEGLKKQLEQLKLSLDLMEQGMNAMAETTDTKIKQADNNDIPKLDKDRIKQIPDRILSDAELVPFIQKTNSIVDKKLSSEDKTQAAQLYNEFKTQYKSATITGHLASTCWMKGFPEIALYIIGKACKDDMKNTDNLNNYASFLTMAGAEESALPILQNLNVKFPGNSTILNNIGQAWFGLGDINKAKLYLDSTISVSRHHSKANETKSKIEKAEGRTEEAIKSIKESIKEAYSSEKEDALNEMGGKLEYEDVIWKYPKPFSPFGLEKFLQAMPGYPLSLVDAEQLNADWIQYREQLDAVAEKLDKEVEDTRNNVDAFEAKLRNISNQQYLLNPYNNPVYKTAVRKLALLEEWHLDKGSRIFEQFSAVHDSIEKMKVKFEENLSKAETCDQRNAAISAFMIPANLMWHDIQLKKIIFEKQYLSERISYFSYATVDKSYFEWGKAALKRQFVTLLIGLNYEFANPCVEEKKPEGKRGKLPDFDEVNCNYREEISIPLSKYTIECNKITWEFNAQFLKITHSTDLNTGNTINGSVEIGAFKDLPGTIPVGPLTVEAVAEGSVAVEFDGSGITDVVAKAGAKVQVGVNVPSESKEGLEIHTQKTGPIGIYEVTSLHAAELAGVHARMGWNSGFSAGGKTILGGGHH